MPLPARTFAHRVAIDVPVEDFKLVLAQESIDHYFEFEFPELTEMLEGMEDVSEVEYNGHFGSALYATFELDENGDKPQLDLFIENVETYIEDLRRVDRLMPDLFVFPRHRLQHYLQEDREGGTGARKLIYSHPEFVLSDSADDDVVTVFYLKDGVPAMKDVHAPDLRDMLFADRDARSFDPHKRKAVNLSRGIETVDAVILSHIMSPAQARRVLSSAEAPKPRPVADFSAHFLIADVPEGATPLHAAEKWIVADSGPAVGASITFRSEGEAGAKYFTDGARDQLLGLAEKNPAGLDKWIRRTLPDDLDGPQAPRRPR